MEPRYPRKEDRGHENSSSRGQPTDLSRETIGRLDAFRFQPSQRKSIQNAGNERLPAPKIPLLDEEAPANKNSNGNCESWKSTQLLDSKDSVEATRPLDCDLPGRSQMLDDDHLSSATNQNSSPSPFEIDDFDHNSLEDAFQAAEDDINMHASDLLDHENLISLPEAQHTPSTPDSDFGSDPFEPDDAAKTQDGLYQGSSALADSFSSPPGGAAHFDFPRPEENLESMLPPSYQTPRKTLTIENTSTKLATFQPFTPDSRPIHKRVLPQPPSPTPFLRSNFPKPVPARSPISNLTSTARILTCFRTAEYLRAISTSASTPGLLIELYALVTSSTRVGDTQHFTLADLFFPQRPPHLHGTSTTWQGSELYEHDTGPFLSTTKERGKLCRAIVRPRTMAHPHTATVGSSPLAKGFAAEGGNPGHGGGQAGQISPLGAEVEVLNIWEAAWEDVEYVRRIVGA